MAEKKARKSSRKTQPAADGAAAPGLFADAGGDAPLAAPVADQASRDLIVRELDRNMLVEAAAGTGKTTSMVARMVALIATGRSQVETLAAVTFTRKAAGELRTRFQLALESAVAQAAAKLAATSAAETASEQLVVESARLSSALAKIERCFIGTIHSFCARLLRERPVEAGVGLAFEEIDEEADLLLREQAWQEYVTGLLAGDAPILDELDQLGLQIGDLARTFYDYADYPDVDEWPAGKVELSAAELQTAAAALERYGKHLAAFGPHLPREPGNDKLMAKFQVLARLLRQLDLAKPAELMEALGEFRLYSSSPVVQKNWPGGKEQAKAEVDRWNEFTSEVALPLQEKWHQVRYEPVLRAIRPAQAIYDRLRAEGGWLNYQDLLMKSADLLRDKPGVRSYFRSRFTHLLVDEFQDTDPIQAEVMMLLTADDPRQESWAECRPAAGALFVVGDPKQSIYRFRRADIVTYNRVRQIIEQSGGMVAPLTTNFRTVGPLVDWVNRVTSAALFTNQADSYSPEDRPMQAGRLSETAGTLQGILRLTIKDDANKASVTSYESDLLARVIRHAIDRGLTIPRSRKELEAGRSPSATPGDFLIITRNTSQMGRYAEALQRYGVPREVTGGCVLNEVPELALLTTCLAAVVHRESPVALVAALRSELFGLADTVLYAFKKAGGRFAYAAAVPAGFEGEDEVRSAFGRLRKYACWLVRKPAVSAVEMIMNDLGLPARAAAAEGGNVRAGSLSKVIELLRAVEAELWTAGDLVDYLRRLSQREENEEPHDGLPARPHAEPAVRIMNLHKSKGLEAPVVFLADPTGESSHAVRLHIDRRADRVYGYMVICGAAAGYEVPVLAKPAGWDELAEEESHFQEAESRRLLYVAATRPIAQLIISQRSTAGRNEKNPWHAFGPYLEAAAELEDPGPVVPPKEEVVWVGSGEAARAEAEMAARWSAAGRPSYEVQSVRAMAVPEGVWLGPGDANGREWGTVIHSLLEAARQAPVATLRGVALSLLEEQELSLDLADLALGQVAAVMASDIWRRAMRSEFWMTEVPIQVPSLCRLSGSGGKGGEGLGSVAGAGSAESGGREVAAVQRGVIDLIFKEPDGWVIVDYKTDDVPGRDIGTLCRHFRGQVQLYAEMWARASGQPVKEFGLFFVRSGEYRGC